jgi:hypothetical protein
LPSLGARERDIGYRQQEANSVTISVIELARIQHEASRYMILSEKIDLIGLDLGAPRRGGSQQRT